MPAEGHDLAELEAQFSGAPGVPDRRAGVGDLLRRPLVAIPVAPIMSRSMAITGWASLTPVGALRSDSKIFVSTSSGHNTDTPTPGAGFFYLVRLELGFSVGGYGQGTSSETRTGTGGCSP